MKFIKTYFAIAISLFLSINLVSQDLSCEQIPKLIQSFSPPPPLNNPFEVNNHLVKLYYHIIRDDNGNGNLTVDSIFHIHEVLNSYFFGSGFEFYFNECEVDYIDSTYLVFTSDWCSFWDHHNHQDGIDIHLRDDFTDQIGVAKSIPGDEIVVGGKHSTPPLLPFSLSSVLAHEVGHCLGLFHTHAGICPEISINCINGDTTLYQDATNNDFVGRH